LGQAHHQGTHEGTRNAWYSGKLGKCNCSLRCLPGRCKLCAPSDCDGRNLARNKKRARDGLSVAHQCRHCSTARKLARTENPAAAIARAAKREEVEEKEAEEKKAEEIKAAATARAALRGSGKGEEGGSNKEEGNSKA
jgi:glutaredoxin